MVTHGARAAPGGPSQGPQARTGALGKLESLQAALGLGWLDSHLPSPGLSAAPANPAQPAPLKASFQVELGSVTSTLKQAEQLQNQARPSGPEATWAGPCVVSRIKSVSQHQKGRGDTAASTPRSILALTRGLHHI